MLCNSAGERVMNLILLSGDDYIQEQLVRLSDYRCRHITQVHKAVVGDTLRVGDLSGCMGTGTVVAINSTAVTMTVDCNDSPPVAPPITLILALPRPKVLKRVLITATTLGIKRIILLNSWRVDKSYWQTPVLQQEQIESLLITGLEQARDTILPLVEQQRLFKPFVQDQLPAIISNGSSYVAHPGSVATAKSFAGDCRSVTIVVGPEGGFIPYEIELLTAAGVQPLSIGERILRVETAVTVLSSYFL